jgi:hypothetical protein
MMRALAALSVVALAAGCRAKATRAECDEMVERYIDLSLSTDAAFAKLPAAQRSVVREMTREVKKGDRRFAKVELRCESEVTSKERDCALGAATAAEWEACIR